MLRFFFQILSQKTSNILHTDGRKLLKSSFWLSFGQVISILSGIITSALLVHYLSENDYGIYRYMITLGVIFTSFSLTGMGQSILQSTAKKYYEYYAESIRVSALYSISTIIIALSASVYYLINNDITLFLGCLLIALLQPFLNIYINIFSYLQGSGRYKETTLLHSAKMVFIATATLFALFFSKDPLVLLAIYLLSYGAANYFTHICYRPKFPGKIDTQKAQPYTDHAKHVSLQNLVLNVSAKLDSVIIFTQLGATELAIFTIANIIPDQIKASFKNVSNLMFPSFVKYDNWKKLHLTVKKRSLQLLCILVFITFLYIVTAPIVYGLLFPKYNDAILYSQLLALTFPFFVMLVPNNALQAQLQNGALYKISIITSVVNIVSLLILVTLYGLIGAIIARFIYRLTYTLLSFGFFFKKHDN